MNSNVEQIFKWLSSLKLIVGVVVGAFLTGGSTYVAWGAVAKKAVVEEAISAVNQKIAVVDKSTAVETARIATKVDSMADDMTEIRQDVRATRQLIESWAKPPRVR